MEDLGDDGDERPELRRQSSTPNVELEETLIVDPNISQKILQLATALAEFNQGHGETSKDKVRLK